MTWSWNDGELVIETPEITDSTRRDVLMQLANVEKLVMVKCILSRPRTHIDSADFSLHVNNRVLARVEVHSV